MNNQLLEKIIKSNDVDSCPEFTYENPLLDRNVAKAVARSLVKILTVSQTSSNINKNLRHSVLANIRKTCRLQPDDHNEVGEITTNLLREIYMEDFRDPHLNKTEDPLEKELDKFLIHKLKELDVDSNYKSSLDTEIAQSLLNLDDNSTNTISRRVLDLDSGKKSTVLVKYLWTRPCEGLNYICDVSLKMKPELEKTLLQTCQIVLTEECLNLEELFRTTNLLDLIDKCSISPECFQICCGILNHIFDRVNYCLNIQLFISEFVSNVKKMCCNSISVLYPSYLGHIVVLLDFDLRALPITLQEDYIQRTLPYLIKLQSESDPQLIMLLSHYPEWFDIYFAQ